MSRRQPSHLPENKYHTVRETHLPQSVSSHPDDCALIEALQLATSNRTGGRTLGYLWIPDAIELARRITETTLFTSVPVRHFKSFEEISVEGDL
jgi:hypothetical protein